MEERYYYLNREANGDGFHYIHAYECDEKPSPLFLIKLGFFSRKRRAIREAKKYYQKVRCCQQCCSELKETYLGFFSKMFKGA